MALSERGRAYYKNRTRQRREDRLVAWYRDRDAHLKATHWRCEIGPLLAAHGHVAYLDCAGTAVTCHHALARGMGGSLDNSVLLSACDPCHRVVEANPALAKQIGAKILHAY